MNEFSLAFQDFRDNLKATPQLLREDNFFWEFMNYIGARVTVIKSHLIVDYFHLRRLSEGEACAKLEICLWNRRVEKAIYRSYLKD